MGLVGRKYTQVNSVYRYGFNGKEVDKDISEGGQDYGMRIYDSRLGRFLSVDPLQKKYPELTPYQFASNRPIDGIDLDGLEFLDAKKYNKGAVWGIQKFKISSSEYTVNDLLIKNKAVHNIVISHPDNKKPYGAERPDDPGEANTMTVKQRASSAKSQAFSNMEAGTARREGAADIVGGIVDGIKWGIKTGYNIQYSKELNYGNASIAALNKADNLVRDAVGNPTFPQNLLSPSVLTDLTNYLTDGSKPNGGIYYDNVITTWGDLLYSNRDAVNNGSFNFSPVKTTMKTVTISGPSDIKIPLSAPETTGNPDPAVNKANKLIEKQAPQRTATVAPGG